MDNFENQKELLYASVEQKIGEIRNNPPTEEELDIFTKKMDLRLKNFINGGSLEELEIEGSEPGSIELPDFDLMSKVLLNLGLDEELVRELVEHEQAHYREMVNLNFIPKINLTFFKQSDGSTGLKPSVSFDIPKDADPEVCRRHLRIILEAPIDLSPSDQERVDFYKK